MALSNSPLKMFQHAVAVMFFILAFLKSLLHCLTFALSDVMSMLKCSWL